MLTEKPSTATEVREDPVSLDARPDDVEQDKQDGVRVAEAVTSSWSKRSLMIVYASMWMIYFVQALQWNLTANLSAYITSDFSQHSMLTVIYIIISIMTAACTMPIAKILNLWDRTLGLSLMVLIAMIGLVMMAGCNNIGTYCAAQVFYYVGFTGLIFSIDVLTADTSSMRNRGLAFAFTASPYMITAFAGAPLSEQFHATNWRWAYGAVVILLPVVASPLIVTWELAKRKALKEQKFEYKRGNRTWTESLWFYFIEFDVAGILLLIAGFSLFLLSFVLAQSTPDQWRSAKIISMIVVGAVVITGFVAYERFVAPKPFIPYHLLTSRTVIGACLLDFTYQVAYYCWASYFTSYLQVVFNVSITKAGYINSIFDFISPLWLIGAGFLIRTTGRFKWLLLCAVPLYMLAVGLMIHFRSPGNNIGYIIMCEIFMALGGGTIILVMQIAVMAASKHDDYAAMLALLSLFGNLGGAVGNSISGAIWTNTLPAKLQELLPEEALPDWETIYGSLEVQLSYPVGSATRTAITTAYALSQRNMLIAGTAIMALSIGWVFLMKNIRIQDAEQMKGVLF